MIGPGDFIFFGSSRGNGKQVGDPMNLNLEMSLLRKISALFFVGLRFDIRQ